MTFLRGASSLPCRLVHDTGTMIRFTTSQLKQLPPSDVNCTLELPDGAVVDAHFHLHPRNPYIGGQRVVRWIKSWVPYKKTLVVLAQQIGAGNHLRLQVPELSVIDLDPLTGESVRTAARRLRRVPQAERRRRLYAAWERDPTLRSVALRAWGANCQVVGCSCLASVPRHLRDRLVDVHHLNHISKGGTDSPLNVCVVCVVHHQMIHRAPTTELKHWDLEQGTVRVNGLELLIVRDARLIW